MLKITALGYWSPLAVWPLMTSGHQRSSEGLSAIHCLPSTVSVVSGFCSFYYQGMIEGEACYTGQLLAPQAQVLEMGLQSFRRCSIEKKYHLNLWTRLLIFERQANRQKDKQWKHICTNLCISSSLSCLSWLSDHCLSLYSFNSDLKVQFEN